MSKVNSEVLKESIRSIFHDQKKRKFTETIELQIGLKNYDPTKDKRFSGSLQLPHPCKANMKFCLLGTELDCDKAEALGLEFKNVEMMKAYKKNKKVIKRMAKSYDAFLASQTLIRQIPRLLGRCFCGFLCKCAACAGVVSLPLSRGSLVFAFRRTLSVFDGLGLFACLSSVDVVARTHHNLKPTRLAHGVPHRKPIPSWLSSSFFFQAQPSPVWASSRPS
jgi:Ribosomal protein L1p/L10e family